MNNLKNEGKLRECPLATDTHHEPYIVNPEKRMGDALWTKYSWVQCSCGVHGPASYGDNATEEAIKAWNTRRSPTSTEDDVYYRIHKIATKLKSYIAGHPNIYVMLDDIEKASTEKQDLSEEAVIKVLEDLANKQLSATIKAVDKKGLMNTDWCDIDAEGGALDFKIIAKAIVSKFTPRKSLPSVEKIYNVLCNSWDFESGNDREERFSVCAATIHQYLLDFGLKEVNSIGIESIEKIIKESDLYQTAWNYHDLNDDAKQAEQSALYLTHALHDELKKGGE